METRHSEESLEALSRMQYDLFCQKNRLARSIISVVCVLLGVVYYTSWWALLLIAYGCYLTTSTYSSANRTAHKLAAQMRAAGGFPRSRYVFEKKQMRVFSLPDEEELTPLAYEAVAGLGEDRDAFYLFRDSYGGYRVPKSALGDREEAFRDMIEARAGRRFARRRTPFNQLRDWMKRKENEPEHL